ncbi:MAG TPA: preprotein translocase subunit SecG [Chitinivibrionales bacterium]|jgi:preprotein translocase subunit SecG|nr:preprotein translocase subunit SecG [Chitinivibrionales bacterium]
MLFGIGLVIFVIICVFLCLLILIQSDKGGGISGALGGGFSSATNLLGSQDTANILTRATAISAGIYLGLCLLLSIFLSHPSGAQVKSALKERAEKQGNYSPASALQGQQGLPLGNPGGGGAALPSAGLPAPQGAMPQTTPAQGGQAQQAPLVVPKVPAPSKGTK